ncbi:hypothetical protein [Myxococcus sp. Y35]|uniref:hypothetical protein n=1 Tax=Pseudomyxococcus flavus TaxID=3115648 RepID=UPI003CF68EC2
MGLERTLAIWPGADSIQDVVKRPVPEREDSVLPVDLFGSAAVVAQVSPWGPRSRCGGRTAAIARATREGRGHST